MYFTTTPSIINCRITNDCLSDLINPTRNPPAYTTKSFPPVQWTPLSTPKLTPNMKQNYHPNKRQTSHQYCSGCDLQPRTIISVKLKNIGGSTPGSCSTTGSSTGGGASCCSSSWLGIETGEIVRFKMIDKWIIDWEGRLIINHEIRQR